MRTKIFIENTELDLFEDIDTSFTFAIDDVKDFGSRNTSFSKTIIIPGNSVNNKAFGHVFNFGSSNLYDPNQPNVGYNFNPSVSARCVVLVDQVQIFKGALRLMEIVDTDGQIEYECFIFGELGGFINQLGNRKLEDLDFSDLNIEYSFANITASWDTVSGNGVYFPLIDYGNVSTNKEDFQYTAFRPALYVRDYLERIFSNTDYTVESNFFLEPLFDRLIIPHNQKDLTKLSYVFFQGSPEVATYNSTGTSLSLKFDASVLGAFVLQNGDTEIKNTGSTITTDLVFIINGNWSQGGAATFNIRKNGSIIGSAYLGSGFSGYFFTKTITAYNISIATNDVITLTLDWSPSQAYNLSISAGEESQSIRFESGAPTRVPINLGEEIPINDTLPLGIFQRDFFISILKMFNLYVYESAFDENKIYIEPYIDFYQDAQVALDWSKKIDRSKPIRQTPMSELNARFFRYKFREDNDFYNENYRKAYNEGYGDFVFDTEFEFSNDTDTLEVIFANSVLYQNTGTDKIYPAIYKLSGTTETGMDSVIRIMQAKKITCDSYDILDGVSVVGSVTDYGYAGHLNNPNNPTNDICFGAPGVLQFSPSTYPTTNIFNAYHSEYIAEITDKDSKLITCYAYLTQVDIMQLDFSKLIWVDGVLFRLNKIIDYNPIDLGVTEIQLLKVVS